VPSTDVETIRAIVMESAAAHQRFAEEQSPRVAAAAAAIGRAIREGGKVLAFGNGGSASDAEHLVAELVGRFERDRRGLPAIALTANSSVLTSTANDFGFEACFSRQIDALASKGDVAVAISTSGRSPNVVTALAAARKRGVVTIALTGRDGGDAAQHADIHVHVAEQSTPRIQELHRTVLHAICAIVEQNLELRT